ncbi:hypothetical protein, variant [Capsaspora owczarzaki ATCC 30864]|nr:hypothetical protein, variant [Capsaspora owczarzaki ATCC 30864]
MQKLQQEEELARAQSGEEGKDAGKSLTSTVSGFFGSITASIASAAAPAPATALASGSLGSAGAASGSSLTQGAAMPTSRADALLVALQTNPATYTADIPANQRQRYDAWVSTANVDAMTEQISQLLGDHPEVRTLHTKLVPSTISYTLFWQHYFFRVHLLREEERNRAKLKERMESSVIEDVDWDDDDDPTPTRQDTPPSQTAPPLSQDSSTSTLRTVLSAVEQPAPAPAVTTARQRSSEAPSDDDDEIHQILQTSRSPVATLAPEPAAPPKAAPLQPSPFSGLPAPFSSEPALNTPASAVLSHASSRSTSTTSTESFELVLPGNNSGMVVTTNATGTTTRVSHPPAAVGGDVEDDDWETWE